MKLKIATVTVIILIALIFIAWKGRTSIHAEATFNAPVAKVWALWNDPESMKKWWGPTGYSSPEIKMDFREGGGFLYAMKSPTGEVFWNSGTYTKIVPNSQVLSKMSFSDETGRVLPPSEIKVPGNWPEAVIVEVEFKDIGGTATQVIITEKGIPLIMKIFARMGWEQQFKKFEELLK